jgi:hypothetical protein
VTEGTEQTRDQDLAHQSSYRDPGRADREQIRDELQRRRQTFHALLDSLSPEDLKRPSNGTRWNNEQLLFHMLFGYIVVLVLIRMVKVLGLLPRPATKPFASLLNALTGPFNVVNYWGLRFGANFYNRKLGIRFEGRAVGAAQFRNASLVECVFGVRDMARP